MLATQSVTRKKEVKKRVELLLATDQRARNSDKYLLVKYLQVYHNIDHITDILREDIPAIETIRRSRQILQAQYPLVYGAVEEVAAARQEEQAIHEVVYDQKNNII